MLWCVVCVCVWVMGRMDCASGRLGVCVGAGSGGGCGKGVPGYMYIV